MGNFVEQLQHAVATKRARQATAREQAMKPESIRKQLEKALWKAAQAGRCGITVGTCQCGDADVRLLTHRYYDMRKAAETAAAEIDDQLTVETHRSTSVYVKFPAPKEEGA